MNEISDSSLKTQMFNDDFSDLFLNKSIREVSCENISVNPFQIEKKANALGLFRHVCWVPYSTAYDKVSMLPSFSDVVKKVSYI